MTDTHQHLVIHRIGRIKAAIEISSDMKLLKLQLILAIEGSILLLMHINVNAYVTVGNVT